MAKDCFEKLSCRLCESRNLETVIELTSTPLANAFIPPELKGQPEPFYPLVVKYCGDCHHLQLGHVVDPSSLFCDYVYVSGTSRVFRNHFAEYAQTMIDRAALTAADLVIDIGSNDGTLLHFFQESGIRTLGVDPATNIARKASEDGIETLNDFFSAMLAKAIMASYGGAKLITANNVFAHIDDLRAVVEAVKILFADDGLFVFEVSYLVDVLNDLLFDTIYHEHLDYHAIGPLLAFFQRQEMRVLEVQRVSTHGGSIRVIVCRDDSDLETHPSVEALTALEQSMGLDEAQTYRRFSDRIDELGRKVSALIYELRKPEVSIAGFGAPAKATTLLFHFGIGELIDFIVDDNPLKQGLLTPGYHIPIISRNAFYERMPDYTLILAWNFADSIISSTEGYIEQGGCFITPLPKLRVTP